MELTRDEVALLMRSLLRSLEPTPARERDAHKRLYDRLSAEFFRLTPQKKIEALARALGDVQGEYIR
jgi:hypothetical protein